MESDRDFEFLFGNGVKLHFDILSKQWTWNVHNEQEKDPELQKLATACFQKCVLWAEIGQRSGDSFPLVISHKSANTTVPVHSLIASSSTKTPLSPTTVPSNSSQGSTSFSSFSMDSTSYVSSHAANNQNSGEADKMEKEVTKLKQEISNLVSEKESLLIQLKESQVFSSTFNFTVKAKKY